MGNEASMEGGDGALAGELTGPEAELSRLSEEERRRLVSTMAEAQARRVVVYSGRERERAFLGVEGMDAQLYYAQACVSACVYV